MSKGKSIVMFILMLCMIAGLAYTAAFGLQMGDWLIPKVFDEEHGVRKGLDLVGGSVITFEAQLDPDMPIDNLSASMDVVVEMLRQRLNFLGYYEAQLTKSADNRRVRVEIPAISDPEEAVQKLGSTAQLSFVDADGNVVLRGNEIKAARAQVGTIDNTGIRHNYVEVEFTDEAARKFAETTGRYVGEPGKNFISIVLDEEVISSPTFDTRLDTDTVIIRGNYTPEDASWLANIISAGQLPFSLAEAELRSVGPQLGEKALDTCLQAGLIGVILIMVFMLLYYRLSGLLADILLVGYIAIVGMILSIFQLNLSLPGIAGIVLSIGMAVDANVIIFERIKEELRVGKSVRASIDAGFTSAFTAIIDANVTTLIAAGVLYYFGTGPIQGFAITLTIGILVSMFTAIVLTRLMLKLAVGMNIKNPWAYGM